MTGPDARNALVDIIAWWDSLPSTLRQDIEGSGAEPGVIAAARRIVRSPHPGPSREEVALPTLSAMTAALSFLNGNAQAEERLARTVSGAGEGAELYRDAAKCVEFALSHEAPAQIGIRELIDFVSSQRQKDIDPELRDAILNKIMALSKAPAQEPVADGAKVHFLKTWPEYFEAILSGQKTFEWRIDDRGFQVGDTLVLQEYIPNPENAGREGRYTGRDITRKVTFLFNCWPTNKRTVVMSLAAPASHGATREALEQITEIANYGAKKLGEIDPQNVTPKIAGSNNNAIERFWLIARTAQATLAAPIREDRVQAGSGEAGLREALEEIERRDVSWISSFASEGKTVLKTDDLNMLSLVLGLAGEVARKALASLPADGLCPTTPSCPKSRAVAQKLWHKLSCAILGSFCVFIGNVAIPDKAEGALDAFAVRCPFDAEPRIMSLSQEILEANESINKKELPHDGIGGPSCSVGSYAGGTGQTHRKNSEDCCEYGDDNRSSGSEIVMPTINQPPNRPPKGDYFTGGAIFLGTLLAFAGFAVLLQGRFAKLDR